MLNLHFFLVVKRGNFKILYISIIFPAYKDTFNLDSDFKWFDSHAKIFGDKL